MRAVYPVILTQTSNGYVSFVPDLNINSQGKDIAEVILMTRDAIEMWCCYEDDLGHPIPEPNFLTKHELKDNQTITLVDIDWLEYRKKNDNKAVKKTLTIPNWLNVRAEKANINFSQTLQDALQKRLGL